MYQIDNVASHSESNNNSVSFNLTIGNLGLNGLVVVGAVGKALGINQTAQRITGITFNGVAMTLVASDERTADGTNSCSVALYELHGASLPVAGTYTVVVTYAGTPSTVAWAGMGALSFTGAKRTTAEATATTNAHASGAVSQNILTISNNALVIVIYGSQNENVFISFSTGETLEFNEHSGSGEKGTAVGAYKIVATPATVMTTINVNNPEDEAMVLAAFSPDSLVQAGMM